MKDRARFLFSIAHFLFFAGLQEYVEAYSFYYYILSERLVEWKEVGVHCIGSLPFYCLCQYSLPTLVSSPILFLGLSCHCQQQQRIFLPKSFCFPPSSMGKKTGLEMRKLLERGRENAQHAVPLLSSFVSSPGVIQFRSASCVFCTPLHRDACFLFIADSEGADFLLVFGGPEEAL